MSLDPAAVDVDVVRFEEDVAQPGVDAMERAVELYRGDLLEGFEVKEAAFEHWLVAERERLRGTVLEALAKLMAHREKAGATERAIETAARLLALDRALAIGEALGDLEIRVLADVRLGQAHHALGRSGQAVERLTATIAALSRERPWTRTRARRPHPR